MRFWWRMKAAPLPFSCVWEVFKLLKRLKNIRSKYVVLTLVMRPAYVIDAMRTPSAAEGEAAHVYFISCANWAPCKQVCLIKTSHLSRSLWFPGLFSHWLSVKHLFCLISTCQINSNVWRNRPRCPRGAANRHRCRFSLPLNCGVEPFVLHSPRRSLTSFFNRTFLALSRIICSAISKVDIRLNLSPYPAAISCVANSFSR